MMLPKPAKGSGLIARKLSRNAVKAYEDRQKQIVRNQDGFCRWPFCENCRLYKPRLEVAHLIAKGQGGDHGNRSAAENMILVDYLTHQGPGGLEQHGRKVIPLTEKGSRGPCEFWLYEEGVGWFLVAREHSLHCYERD